jgi:predicted TPR repeat methyltransferase
MTAERTLVVDLDQRIDKSPRFQANSVREYFQNSKLDWWKTTEPAYLNQERLVSRWLEGKCFQYGLEIGPGFGRITKLITPKVENLTLIEINKRAIKKLYRQFPSARILNKPAENFEDWEGNYGLIVAVEILVHIPNLPNLLDAINRSLNKGGLFITSITPDDFYKGKRTIIHRGINPEEFADALNQRKLSVVEKVQKDNILTYCLSK